MANKHQWLFWLSFFLAEYSTSLVAADADTVSDVACDE